MERALQKIPPFWKSINYMHTRHGGHIREIEDLSTELGVHFAECGIEFPLTPMRVLAPGSAHVTPSAQPPIDVSGNFSGSHVWSGGGGD
jgi:hypothetical protein